MPNERIPYSNVEEVILCFVAEEKEPYEAKAQTDKKRYKDEMSVYKPKPKTSDTA